MNRPPCWFRASLRGRVSVPLLAWFAGIAGAAEGLVPGWEQVLEQPGLSAEEQLGAQFLAGHLAIDTFSVLPPAIQRQLLRYAAKHRDGAPPLVVCWHQDTPREIVEAFRLVEQAGQAVRREDRRPTGIGTAFQADLDDHWQQTATHGSGQGAQGQPVTLTWSIVPDGTIIPGNEVGGEATNGPSNLRAWLAGLYGGSATGPAADQPWFPLFEAIFDNIAEKTGLRYVYEPNDDGWDPVAMTGTALSGTTSGRGVLGVRGDVRIAGHTLDGNSNVLAYNYFPDFSDMVIDTSDNFFNITSGNSLRLRNVLEHEHGHGLGLQHVCPLDNTKLMEPFVNLGFTGFQFDDIYTAQRLYGDPREVNGSDRDNDVLARAAPLATPVNVPFVSGWLGIDGDADVDCFRFDVAAGTQLTVRVTPSSASYLEGEQNLITGNCTAGTAFDSSVLQDLWFEVIDSDQTTVLATAASQPAGQEEAVENLIISQADTYYVRVRGSGVDINQLYQLEVAVSAPSVALQVTAVTLDEELFQGVNGVPDPGETIRLDVELTSVGLLGGTNFEAQLGLPPGSQGFDVLQDYGDLGSGAAATRSFVFAPAGSCGETVGLELQVSADGGFAATLPLPLTLGFEQVFFAEDFDASGSLPAGWTSDDFRKGSGWSVSGTASKSAPSACFAANASQAGSSTLSSPLVSVGDNPGTLSFFHHYDTESGWDGGVLEIRIGAGDWQDITTAGGSFLQGGYNLALAGNNNPLAERSGWSGDSGGFIETRVALPAGAANQDVQFRWILGHDVRVGGVGWYLDDIVYRNFVCDESGVALTLSSADTSASELADPADLAELVVSAVLPVPSSLPVTLQASGTADPATDLSGFGSLTLTPGNASVSATLTAVFDDLVEGTETLQVVSPEAAGMVELSIIDSPYGQWAAATLGTVGAVLPGDDFDGDGSTNVEELVYGTDGASVVSTPAIVIYDDGNGPRVDVPLASLPLGVHVDGEGSADLVLWHPGWVTGLPDGFRLSAPGGQGFLRLRYEVSETP